MHCFWDYTHIRSLTAALFVLTGMGFAQNTGCIAGDCQDGAGVYALEGGNRYIGMFKNYMMHGIGTYIYSNGKIYTGEFYENNFQGFGLENADGRLYAGDYYFDQRHGHAVYSWADTMHWEGRFENDTRAGWGTLTRADGSYLTGTWIKDDFQWPEYEYDFVKTRKYLYSCDEFCDVLTKLFNMRINSFENIFTLDENPGKPWLMYSQEVAVHLPCTSDNHIVNAQEISPDYEASFGSSSSTDLAEPILRQVEVSVRECFPDLQFIEMDRDDGYTYITIGKTYVRGSLHPLMILRIADDMEGNPEVQLHILGSS